MTVELIIKALVAGAVGTVVMNLSSETEMNYRGRAASTSPGRATNKLLSYVGFPVLEPDGRTLKILSSWTHYLYGTAWGLVLWAYFGELGWPVAMAGPAFFFTVWLTEQIELPSSALPRGPGPGAPRRWPSIFGTTSPMRWAPWPPGSSWASPGPAERRARTPIP